MLRPVPLDNGSKNVSTSVSQHVAESAPSDGVVFTDAGEVELKGFACPVRRGVNA